MSRDRLMAQFESFRHQFEDHLETKTGRAISFNEAINSERVPKMALVKAVRALLQQSSDPVILGKGFYKAVDKHLKSIHRIEATRIGDLEKLDKLNYDRFCSILGDALLSSDTEDDIFFQTNENILKFLSEKILNSPGRSTMVHLLFVALACKKNSKTIFGMITFFGDVTEFFLGSRLFGTKDPNIKQSFNLLNNLVCELSNTMSSKWGWNVQDNIDVQSALWVEFKNNKPKYDAFLKTRSDEHKQVASITRNYNIEIKNLPAETEKLSTVKQRCGQSALRSHLIKTNVGRCLVTGITNEKLLRVSHIKPWSECIDRSEKLDPNNCLLLSGLWDLAFDKGLLSFDEAGKVIFSEELKTDKSSINFFKQKHRIVFTEKQKSYMHWHRTHVLRN